MNEKRRIFLVDDHPLVREWLSNLVNQQPDLVICGEAEDAPHALDGVRVSRPDVAVIDITLKSGSGVELIKEITRLYPDIAVVVLTMHDESLYAERTIRAGAKGYVMKSETTKNVISAIRHVLEGKTYFSHKVTTMMAGILASGRKATEASPISLLSDRELEIFELIGQGYETRQISEKLIISIKTVQAYYARMKDKLGVSTANELVREAIRWHEHKPS